MLPVGQSGCTLHVVCRRLVLGSASCGKAYRACFTLTYMSISIFVIVLVFAQLQACLSQATVKWQDMHVLT